MRFGKPVLGECALRLELVEDTGGGLWGEMGATQPASSSVNHWTNND